METKQSSRKLGIIVILVLSVCSFIISVSTLYAAPNANNHDQKLDVRFVVDMSYDMKKQDPTNNRIRSLQKLVKNLPDGSRSGVWTYGRYVNMLIPLAAVDSSWKKNTIYKLDKIGGYGDYRNLGEALTQASFGWQNKSNYKKYIIVLTNGDYRVSKSKITNAQEQLILLTKTLPRLKKAGIEVHSVSLSKNADNRLLKILASETGGKWYSVASIDRLDNILNHVYAQISKDTATQYTSLKDSVILNKNKSNLSKKSLRDSRDLKTANNLVATNISKPKTSEKSNAVKKVNTSNQKKLHEQSTTSSKLIDEEIKRNKDKQFDYEHRKEMDFNWPTTHSG